MWHISLISMHINSLRGNPGRRLKRCRPVMYCIQLLLKVSTPPCNYCIGLFNLNLVQNMHSFKQHILYSMKSYIRIYKDSMKYQTFFNLWPQIFLFVHCKSKYTPNNLDLVLIESSLVVIVKLTQLYSCYAVLSG